MRPFFYLGLGALMFSTAALADGTIYRCANEDGSIVFSDRPCDDEARAYQGPSSLSVISAPADVQARTEANRAFIEERRERMNEARRTRELPEQQQAPLVPQPARPPGHFMPYRAPPQEARPLPESTAPDREERFSALSGRQPGSVRRQDQ